MPIPHDKAFVTGSYAYGEPNSESDIDLVIRVDPDDVKKLSMFADEVGEYGESGHMHMRFGELNLLCCLTDESYKIWKYGTEQLKQRAPVSRAVACAFFLFLRQVPK